MEYIKKKKEDKKKQNMRAKVEAGEKQRPDMTMALGKAEDRKPRLQFLSALGQSETRKFKQRQAEMALEADVLWYEGKRQESKTLRRIMRAEAKERRQKKWKDLYQFGKRIYDNVAAGVDAMLDSDSDDSDHQRKKEAEKEANKKVDFLKDGRASMTQLANGAVMNNNAKGSAKAGMSLLSSPNIQLRRRGGAASEAEKKYARRKPAPAAKREETDDSATSASESDDSEDNASDASSLSDPDAPRGGARDGQSEEEYLASFKYYSKKDSMYGRDGSEVCAIM